MKRFLIKVLSFFGLIIIFYFLSFIYLIENLKNKISNSEIIILGDSHTKHLNLPDTFNYSIPGAPYIIHLNFLENFLTESKGKKIIIAFGYHNIAAHFENRLRGEVFFPGWLPMVNQELNSLNLISKQNEWQDSKFIENFFLKSRLITLYGLIYNEPVVNSTKYTNDTILFAKTINKFYNSDYVYHDVVQKKYLAKIIKLLINNECKIYLLNTPVTQYYFDNVPIEIIEEYDDLIKKYEHENIVYLDFNSFLKYKIDSTFFKDADHTNAKGDHIIEKYLNEAMFSK